MNERAPAIELDGLRFGWQPDAPVLELAQLAIAQGERVFLHGPGTWNGTSPASISTMSWISSIFTTRSTSTDPAAY